MLVLEILNSYKWNFVRLFIMIHLMSHTCLDYKVLMDPSWLKPQVDIYEWGNSIFELVWQCLKMDIQVTKFRSNISSDLFSAEEMFDIFFLNFDFLHNIFCLDESHSEWICIILYSLLRILTNLNMLLIFCLMM